MVGELQRVGPGLARVLGVIVVSVVGRISRVVVVSGTLPATDVRTVGAGVRKPLLTVGAFIRLLPWNETRQNQN